MSKTAPVGDQALMHAGASISVVGAETARIRPFLRGRKGRFGVQRGGKIGGENTLLRLALSSSSGEPSGPSFARPKDRLR
ncbi:MAG: hypothetical protein FD125_2054, partial [bacterium]